MIQPYILGALAVACYALCLLLHPAAEAFRAGWRFARAWPWSWGLLGLITAHHGWWLERHEPIQFNWPKDFTPAFASELVSSVAVNAGNSVAATLAMPLSAEPFSVVLALGVFLNISQMGRALRRGCDTAFPAYGAYVWWLLLTSALADVVWLASLVSAWLPEASMGLTVLHGVSSLWRGATVAFVLAWLVRLAETHLHAPEEILQIQWPGSAAGRIPRLWPVVLGSALAQCWVASAGHGSGPLALTLTLLGWLLALGGAFLPLLLVHWRGIWTWRAVFVHAGQLFLALWPNLLAWLCIAFTHFFLYHLAHQGVASGLASSSIARLGWDALCALLHAGLLVWLLAAWIAQQPTFDVEEMGAK